MRPDFRSDESRLSKHRIPSYHAYPEANPSAFRPRLPHQRPSRNQDCLDFTQESPFPYPPPIPPFPPTALTPLPPNSNQPSNNQILPLKPLHPLPQRLHLPLPQPAQIIQRPAQILRQHLLVETPARQPATGVPPSEILVRASGTIEVAAGRDVVDFAAHGQVDGGVVRAVVGEEGRGREGAEDDGGRGFGEEGGGFAGGGGGKEASVG